MTPQSDPAKTGPPRVELDDPDRLRALWRTDLLDSPVEEAFDRCTRVLSAALGVPVALVSLVDDARQFFKSAVGLDEPWASRRGTALSHSFCQHVVTADAPFVVDDARQDPRVEGNGAIDDLSVVAYAGAPVRGPDGQPIGSLCAIDDHPRQWSEQDLALLSDLADVTSELIAMRAAAGERRAAVLDLSHRLRTSMTALQLEAEDLRSSASGDQTREQAAHLVEGLEGQSVVLTSALREAESRRLGHEGRVDVRAALAEVASTVQARADRLGREVVVADGPGGQDVAPVEVPQADLRRVVEGLLDLLLEHGRGRISLMVLDSASAVRIRVGDESDGLPAEVARRVTGRRDAERRADDTGSLSLAERAARSLGGRLVLLSSTPTTLDLLIPRR